MQARNWLWALSGFTFAILILPMFRLTTLSATTGQTAEPADSAAVPPLVRHQLRSLTTEELGKIRQQPAHIEATFHKCRDELVQALGPAFADLRERELQYVFCAVVSHTLAPYGESNAICLPDLLQAPALNCSNYGLLAVDLARSFKDQADEDLRVRFVGWAGPTLDNHQTLFLDRGDGRHSLLLDPTVGIVAMTDFNSVASGKAVPDGRLVLFGPPVGRPVFEAGVLAALREGRLRPSDLLYYFDGPEHLREHYGQARYWPTPAACACRAQGIGN
jgi:hypothetical protein